MSEINIRIGHLDEIGSPWGNAGGVVKTTADTGAMALTGVGWIEDGSHTLEKRLGNAVDPEHLELGPQYVVYTHDQNTGISANSLGMPGESLDEVEKEIPDRV